MSSAVDSGIYPPSTRPSQKRSRKYPGFNVAATLKTPEPSALRFGLLDGRLQGRDRLHIGFVLAFLGSFDREAPGLGR